MRIIIVSNRLPIAVDKTGEIKPTIGGLAKGINAFLKQYKIKEPDVKFIWVGVSNIAQERLAKYNCYAVNAANDIMNKFYTGLCNKTIWPLFHYLTNYFSYKDEDLQIYKEVNQIFCNTLKEIIVPGDIVWIHDYHLMLLPEYLRQLNQNILIGYFHHIPFPSFEILQFLPKECRIAIINGLLGANLIGFHTYEYLQHFTKCVVRLTGYDYDIKHIITSEHLVKVEVYPMGVDYNTIQQLLRTSTVVDNQQKIIKSFDNKKIILSIDRLDYTKGVKNRLLAYKRFLKNYPLWHEKVVLVLVVVPSRENVSHYNDIKTQINELTGYINGQFGNINWTPVIYQYRGLESDELFALYSVSDVILVTPIVDGMNLVAKEYVAAKKDRGVLVLSEGAGASKELIDALIINPNSKDEIVDAIKQALEMSEEEQCSRIRNMQLRISRYTVVKWGMDFIQDLNSMHIIEEKINVARDIELSHIFIKYQHAKTRILIFDYDGTLVPFSNKPSHAIISQEVFANLETLTKDSKNKIFIVSGRNKEFLQKNLAITNINIIAEHGAWLYQNGSWGLTQNIDLTFKELILPVLQDFTDRIPGSFIEEKEHSIAWHYRQVDYDNIKQLSGELIDTLTTFTASSNLQILPGNKVIEVRHMNINKGIIKNFIANEDFILVVGDDTTDEDMFRVIPENSYSIKIGFNPSRAKINVATQKNILDIINKLAMI